MQCCKNSRLVPINPCLGIRRPLASTSAFFPLRPRLTRLRTHLIPLRLRLGARPQSVARLVHNAFCNIDKMGVTSTDEQKKNTLQRVPHSKPPFTLGDIKKAIPPHCFRRSLARSFSYVAYNIFIVALLYYTATSYFHLLPSPYYYVAWPIYWVLQGCTSAGFWAIAHECGHNAFSDYRWVDDTVGFILHSALLVPYFSWKYSHRRHHSNSGSLERDESFVPKPKSKVGWYSKYLNNPAGRVVTLAIAFTLGLPLYLAFNVSGRPYERFASHFDPYGPIFINDGERLHVFISDAGVVAASYVLYRIALVKGLAWLLCVYGVPLVIVNGMFALIVYLQHTHPSLPRYDSSEWDWLRGALTTVDRDYGVLNKVFHNATDTHVVHHLFSRIPHYHAVEATKAIKPILGQYYLFDGTPIYKAIWREVRECAYVEPDEDSPDKGIFWYKNKL